MDDATKALFGHIFREADILDVDFSRWSKFIRFVVMASHLPLRKGKYPIYAVDFCDVSNVIWDSKRLGLDLDKDQHCNWSITDFDLTEDLDSNVVRFRHSVAGPGPDINIACERILITEVPIEHIDEIKPNWAEELPIGARPSTEDLLQIGQRTDKQKIKTLEDIKEDIKRAVVVQLCDDITSFWWLEIIIEAFHLGWDQETVHAQAAALVKEWVAEGVMDAVEWDPDAGRFKPWNLGPDETRRRILDELEKLEFDILNPVDVCYLSETDRTFDYIIQNYPEEWERFLLAEIQFIGGRDLQESDWIPAYEEPHSPKSRLEVLLHKYKFEDYLNRDGFHLSEEQKALGDELYGRIKNFYERRHSVLTDPGKILSSLSWYIITKKANKFASLFPSDRVGIYQKYDAWVIQPTDRP